MQPGRDERGCTKTAVPRIAGTCGLLKELHVLVGSSSVISVNYRVNYIFGSGTMLYLVDLTQARLEGGVEQGEEESIAVFLSLLKPSITLSCPVIKPASINCFIRNLKHRKRY